MTEDPVNVYLASLGVWPKRITARSSMRRPIAQRPNYVPASMIWLGDAALKLCSQDQKIDQTEAATSTTELIGQKLRDALFNGSLVARCGLDDAFAGDEIGGSWGDDEFFALSLWRRVDVALPPMSNRTDFVFLDRPQFDDWLNGEGAEITKPAAVEMVSNESKSYPPPRRKQHLDDRRVALLVIEDMGNEPSLIKADAIRRHCVVGASEREDSVLKRIGTLVNKINSEV